MAKISRAAKRALANSGLGDLVVSEIMKLLRQDMDTPVIPDSLRKTDQELHEFKESQETRIPSHIDDQLNLDRDNLTQREYERALIEELADLAQAS